MTRYEQYRLTRYFILGVCFGGIWINRPGLGIDNLSHGSGPFYLFVFLFVFFLVRWCLSR